MSGAAKQDKSGKKQVNTLKSYGCFFSIEIIDNNKRNKKVGKPYHQVADDIQPSMKIGPITTLPPWWPVTGIKQAAEKI